MDFKTGSMAKSRMSVGDKSGMKFSVINTRINYTPRLKLGYSAPPPPAH